MLLPCSLYFTYKKSNSQHVSSDDTWVTSFMVLEKTIYQHNCIILIMVVFDLTTWGKFLPFTRVSDIAG